jgi:hypothetical protein
MRVTALIQCGLVSSTPRRSSGLALCFALEFLQLLYLSVEIRIEVAFEDGGVWPLKLITIQGGE